MFSFLINIIVMRCTSDIRGNPSQHYDVNILRLIDRKNSTANEVFLG